MDFFFDSPILILATASALGLFMAWGIGANDVANAMGTSVGSKAITLKQAVIIAAIFEFLGAYLAGGEVTSTIRKGIVDPKIFQDDPDIFILGMMSCLLAAGLWLLLASSRGWPVSTTHSIVGAIVGFALISKGASSVSWDKILEIASSWVTSPLISGFLAFFIYLSAKKLVLEKENQLNAAVNIIPIYSFLVTLVICLVTTKKGLKYVGLVWSDSEVLTYSVIISIFVSVVTAIFLRMNKESLRSENKYGLGGVEGAFGILMIITACSMAFAHGSNDVANAVGPMAAVVATIENLGQIDDVAVIPEWILLTGAIGIVIGMLTLGYKVIKTVGERITELKPSKGFAAEMATAIVVVLGSVSGIPLSTTHTLVGAVVGIGIFSSNKVNYKSVIEIGASWLITIPGGAVFSIIFFIILKALFGI